MIDIIWHLLDECDGNSNSFEFAKALAELGLRSLPSAQPEFAIPLQWINEYVEKLRQVDNEFANLTASMIETMKNKWCMGQIDKYAEGGEQNG